MNKPILKVVSNEKDAADLIFDLFTPMSPSGKMSTIFALLFGTAEKAERSGKMTAKQFVADFAAEAVRLFDEAKPKHDAATRTRAMHEAIRTSDTATSKALDELNAALLEQIREMEGQVKALETLGRTGSPEHELAVTILTAMRDAAADAGLKLDTPEPGPKQNAPSNGTTH